MNDDPLDLILTLPPGSPEFEAAGREYRERNLLLGDCSLALLAGVLRAAVAIGEQHRDEHDRHCLCGHCQAVGFDPWDELAGMLWPVRQAAAVIDGAVLPAVRRRVIPDTGDAVDDLRALARLADAVADARDGDFGPLRELTGRPGPSSTGREGPDADEPDADDGPDEPAVVG